MSREQEKSSENTLPSLDYAPAYRRQGFQDMIPQISIYFRAILIGVIVS